MHATMNDLCGAFKCSDRMWSFSYDNIEMQQLVKALISSNNMLRREVFHLTEGRQRRITSKLQASAKEFELVQDDTVE